MTSNEILISSESDFRSATLQRASVSATLIRRFEIDFAILTLTLTWTDFHYDCASVRQMLISIWSAIQSVSESEKDCGSWGMLKRRKKIIYSLV